MEEGEKEEEEKREVGKLAVWSVSSAKPGNGVDKLRDSNLDTFWQSDGAQPHLVNIQFQKKVRLQQVAIYVNFSTDESYTPNKISVRAGNSFHDLREIKVVDLQEPVGWVYVSLCPNGGDAKGGEFLRAFLVQLAVLSNHQNGRDTHIHQIKIFGPRHLDVAAHIPRSGDASGLDWFQRYRSTVYFGGVTDAAVEKGGRLADQLEPWEPAAGGL